MVRVLPRLGKIVYLFICTLMFFSTMRCLQLWPCYPVLANKFQVSQNAKQCHSLIIVANATLHQGKCIPWLNAPSKARFDFPNFLLCHEARCEFLIDNEPTMLGCRRLIMFGCCAWWSLHSTQDQRAHRPQRKQDKLMTLTMSTCWL